MRVAMIAVLLVAATPSDAAKSCMTKTEARQHFGSVHIYWHGKDHCWDATPTRRYRQIHRAQKKSQIDKVERKIHIDNVRQKIEEPTWQEAMSATPLDAPVQTRWADRWVDIVPIQLPIVARWVDIVQVPPPPSIEPEPMITPRLVGMVVIAGALTLAIVELLFGGMIHERLTSRRSVPR
jgi:hypothetical protein